MKAGFKNKLPRKKILNGYSLQLTNSVLISALSIVILTVSNYCYISKSYAKTNDIQLQVQNTNPNEEIQVIKTPTYDITTNSGKYISYGISVNGKIIGELSSFSEAKALLEAVKKYTTEKLQNNIITNIDFKETVKIEKVYSNYPSISDSTTLLNYILNGTENKVDYTVVDGDNYWDIAKENNLTVEELLKNNPHLSISRLMPGDIITLTKIEPLITTIISYYTTCEEFTDYGSDIKYVSYMYDNQTKVKKNGVHGVDKVKYLVTEEGGIKINKTEIERSILSYPQNEIILVGTQPSPVLIGSGIFIYPLPNAEVTSRFGPRWGTIHTGTDFALPYNTNIQAADKGIVIFSGWRNSYGNTVEIDHGNGWTTRYAHCNNIYVSVGSQVSQGQIIATVGMTGYTTGPHLHFEIRHYGVAVDPQLYLGTYYIK